MSAPEKITDVTVVLKANIYSAGKVASHTLLFKDGSRKTVGIMYAGSYTFNTDAPEQMDILAGSCAVCQAGSSSWQTYAAGDFFRVPGTSSFQITIAEGIIAEYLCSYE